MSIMRVVQAVPKHLCIYEHLSSLKRKSLEYEEKENSSILLKIPQLVEKLIGPTCFNRYLCCTCRCVVVPCGCMGMYAHVCVCECVCVSVFVEDCGLYTLCFHRILVQIQDGRVHAAWAYCSPSVP